MRKLPEAWQESTDPGTNEGNAKPKNALILLLNINGIDGHELVSSPLKRAVETGSKLKEKLKGNLDMLNSSFAEIPSPGILEDRQTWLREIF
ncbi:MAG: hypothetical protein CM15mP3_11870 [Candidatus Poseidoniales archaeon]|nr:MAG: hypothetical protein CM15mP3_11870 [Candidatus Poseidoniales archaeon]